MSSLNFEDKEVQTINRSQYDKGMYLSNLNRRRTALKKLREEAIKKAVHKYQNTTQNP